MKRRILLLSACFFLFLSGSLVLAEDRDDARGRLPDGRAFRTDAQGNQLVDYIAELELSVESLNRKVIGLEDELTEKREEASRLRSGKPAEANLVEKDLLVSASRPSSSNQDQVVNANTSPKAPDCSAALHRVNVELDSVRSDLDIERKLNAKRTDDFETRLNEVQRDLEARDETIKSMRLELASREQDITNTSQTLTEERNRSAAKLKELEEATRAAERRAEEARAVAPIAVRSDTRAALSAARLRAVDSIRGSMLTELNQVRGLIAQRDQLYRKFSQQKRNVSFKPSPARASSQHGLEEISRGIQSAQSILDINPYRRDLTEIESRVRDDIALMSRVR